jgi:membrane protease subunit HflK
MGGRDIRDIPMPRFKPPNIKLGNLGLVILIILAVALLWSSIFTIQPEEVGVVLTFGKYSRSVEPGLRFKAPFPFEAVYKVPVQEQRKEEFGFRTERAGVRTQYAAASYESESLMLTGDLNVAVVEWITQYRISDPYRYLFKVRNIPETFRDMNEAIMRAVVGDRSADEVLTIGRQEIASEVERRLQELCDQYETGIRVEQIVLQDVVPPDEVKDSFNEVNQAQQERERLINEARAEFNKVVPRARGEAQQMIQEAEGYATDRVNRSKGDAALFDALLAAYRRAPQVTRRRIYLETMQAVLPEVERKVVLDRDLKGLLPLLSLDQGVKQ